MGHHIKSRSTPEWWALGKAGMDGSNGKWNYSTNGAFLDVSGLRLTLL